MLLGENSTIASDVAKETNHRSPRPRSAARAMAGLLARGSTTDADLPGCPVIIGGVVSPLTVAGAATASAFQPAPCSLLIPEGNHQEHTYRIGRPAATVPATVWRFPAVDQIAIRSTSSSVTFATRLAESRPRPDPPIGSMRPKDIRRRGRASGIDVKASCGSRP